jgi:hypothetical protein
MGDLTLPLDCVQPILSKKNDRKKYQLEGPGGVV